MNDLGITVLSKRIAEKHGVTQKKAHDILSSVFDMIAKELQGGSRVFIRNFGVFKVVQVKEKRGRNPRTGEDIIIPARRVVKFVPSKAIRHSLNNRSNTKKTK